MLHRHDDDATADALQIHPPRYARPGLTLGNAARLSIGGQYRLMLDAPNFAFHDRSIGRKQARSILTNGRFRTWFNLHDQQRCRYGVYLQTETGHIRIGDGRKFPKTFRAGQNSTGLELRPGYVWFKPSEDSLLRAGILDWVDRFGERPTFTDPQRAIDNADSAQAPLANSVWNFNVGGLSFEANPGENTWHYRVGTLVLQHGNQTIAGQGGSLLFAVDVDQAVGLWGAVLSSGSWRLLLRLPRRP